MLSTMQDVPLNIARILRYGQSIHADTTITTWDGDAYDKTTFAAVGARAAALAHALRDELGIDADQRVGTFMYNCAEHVETFFAVACMGAVFNPLNKQLMDDQIAHIINHATDEVIVCDQRLAAHLGRIMSDHDCPSVRAVVLIGTGSIEDFVPLFPTAVRVCSYEALLDGRPATFDWPELDERTAAALCYSTGTTGAPKGVAYSHRSIYLHSMSLRTTDSFAVSHGNTFLCCVPIYHVLSWGVPIAAFACGAPLVFPGMDVSAPALARIIAATHPRVAHGVPTLWIALFNHYMAHPPERMSLTEIFVGGSPAPPILIRMWEEMYGVDVVHVWGMTENSPIGTVARPPSGASGEARWRYRISQGRFPASLEYRVVNDGENVTGTDRFQGEIQVRGNWVTGSYVHSITSEPGGPAHVFRGEDVGDGEDKFTPDGWLRTGDVGSVSKDGYLTIEDRARDVIRSGGEWIYSVQLENLVMEAPEVVEAAVIGYPDEKWGERPLAVTVLSESQPRGPEEDRETAEKLRD